MENYEIFNKLKKIDSYQDGIVELLKIIVDWRCEKNYLRINNFISDDRIQELQLIYLISIVNYLFFERDKLKNYFSFFKFVQEKAMKEDVIEGQRLKTKFQYYGL